MSYCFSENTAQSLTQVEKQIRMENLVASNIRQRPIRTLVSVAGVALGVCLIMLFPGLARGMSNDLQRRASNDIGVSRGARERVRESNSACRSQTAVRSP